MSSFKKKYRTLNYNGETIHITNSYVTMVKLLSHAPSNDFFVDNETHVGGAKDLFTGRVNCLAIKPWNYIDSKTTYLYHGPDVHIN